MSVFAIVDSSVRGAKPCAFLRYDKRDRKFSVKFREGVTEDELPMAFAPYAARGVSELDHDETMPWIEERIVPHNRQNLGMVLKAHELEDYDVYELLKASGGRSSQDDFRVVEIQVKESGATDEREEELANLRQKVATVIKEERIRQGLTQSELAAHAGVDQAVVSRVERGCSNATLSLLSDLAKGLGKELKISLI